MADGYRRYADPRLQTAMAPAPASTEASATTPATVTLKRPRTDYSDVAAGPDVHGYYPRDEERTTHCAIRDTETINASYDRYLRNGTSFGATDLVGAGPGGMTSRPVDDPCLISVGGLDGQPAGYSSGRPEQTLPPDASNTLYVEGLPANCTRREVSHIFRPFLGFREVRLVNKESRHAGGDPLVLCFVDFTNASQAAGALKALQDLTSSASSNINLKTNLRCHCVEKVGIARSTTAANPGWIFVHCPNWGDKNKDCGMRSWDTPQSLKVRIQLIYWNFTRM